ncbi:MAG: haloalkane dehalogenase [Candidatus Binatus sp.]|uniref:haloalkane dehalogenase n=1 Tax=Candidatus Binatus sp. TaxID=2811406 RepID=UPI00271BC973|nr:haloalkane dehalogenase [Candidatus Binatus sp.]MDO8433582.1 haloalkane dehalogenase [Candidatus Binatus sp.]
MSDAQISAADPHPRKKIDLLGTSISCVDTGSGDPVVFLHGNPTSSYLWRNIIPHVAPLARCIAPDLIGMGASGPSATGSYRFVDHAKHLDAFFDALNLNHRVTLVVHDWGSALGFYWASRHPDAVIGIAYMEAIVRPLEWSEWSKTAIEIFKALRSPAGENMILDKNIFVERILPGSVMRKLTDAEMDAYRKPFVTAGESRRPMLTWPREIPLDGEPADVTAIVRGYSEWLAKSPIPKLFINADPGAILIGAQREFCRRWPNQRELTVKGTHFIQEDSPAEIGAAIAAWYRSL